VSLLKKVRYTANEAYRASATVKDAKAKGTART
jgi:hypothetical protein